MSGQEAKAPPLRFKSYPEPWEKKRFGDFATLRRGLTYTPADCREKGVRVLRSSNISEETFILHDDDVFVSEQAANIPFAKNGDILITAANGSSHLVGKHALVDGVGKADTVHGGFMLLAESERPEFLDAAMSAAWYKRFIADNMMGGNGALGNLAKSSFDECVFFAPASETEQRCIGSFFRSLDALIAGREKALEKLEALKKSMLLKMFPQGDATVPEVRFKGFVGDWEKKRLGSVVFFSKGKGYSKSDISDSGAPLFLYGRMYTDYSAEVDSVDTFAELQKGSVVSDGDEVVVPGSGETPEDIARASAIMTSGIILGGDLNILKPKNSNEIYTPFLAMALSNGTTSRQIAERAQGKTVVHIHNSDLEDLFVLLPSFPEQQKIGAYFRSLDALLAARREEIGKLKQMKKALLERMFV